MKYIQLLPLVISASLFLSCGADDPLGPRPTVDSPRADGAQRLALDDIAGSLQNPAWSPTGDRLLFTNFRSGYNVEPADLLITSLDGGDRHVLVADGSGNVNLPGTAWDPGTDRVVFSSSREPHDELYLIGPDQTSGDEVLLTDRPDDVAYEGSFSPDGAWVVFESHAYDVEGDGVITRYRLDGTSDYEALTEPGDDCRQPAWSPADDVILYQRRVDQVWSIWVMNTDGSNPRRVTGDADATDATFSPDGAWIVYSGEVPGTDSANLFVIPTAGGDAIQVTHYAGYDGAASWSPDGQTIAFESYPGDADDSPGTALWTIQVPTLP